MAKELKSFPKIRPDWQTKIEKIFFPQKSNTTERSLQALVHGHMTTSKRGAFYLENSKTVPSWSNQFWNTTANVWVKVQYVKKTWIVIPIQIKMQLYSLTRWGKRDVYQISFVHVWTQLEHQVQDLYASHNITFLLVFASHIHCRHQ